MKHSLPIGVTITIIGIIIMTIGFTDGITDTTHIVPCYDDNHNVMIDIECEERNTDYNPAYFILAAFFYLGGFAILFMGDDN